MPVNIARLARWLNQSSSTDANCANLMLFVTENYIHKLGRSMNIAVKHVSTARAPKNKAFWWCFHWWTHLYPMKLLRHRTASLMWPLCRRTTLPKQFRYWHEMTASFAADDKPCGSRKTVSTTYSTVPTNCQLKDNRVQLRTRLPTFTVLWISFLPYMSDGIHYHRCSLTSHIDPAWQHDSRHSRWQPKAIG